MSPEIKACYQESPGDEACVRDQETPGNDAEFRTIPFRIFSVIEKKKSGGKLEIGNYICTVPGVVVGGGVDREIITEENEEKDGEIMEQSVVKWSNESVVFYYH